MPRYQDTGRCKGYAHITFDGKASCNKAMKLHKQYMGKRYIDVALATGKKEVVVKSNFIL